MNLESCCPAIAKSECVLKAVDSLEKRKVEINFTLFTIVIFLHSCQLKSMVFPGPIYDEFYRSQSDKIIELLRYSQIAYFAVILASIIATRRVDYMIRCCPKNAIRSLAIFSYILVFLFTSVNAYYLGIVPFTLKYTELQIITGFYLICQTLFMLLLIFDAFSIASNLPEQSIPNEHRKCLTAKSICPSYRLIFHLTLNFLLGICFSGIIGAITQHRQIRGLKKPHLISLIAMILIIIVENAIEYASMDCLRKISESGNHILILLIIIPINQIPALIILVLFTPGGEKSTPLYQILSAFIFFIQIILAVVKHFDLKKKTYTSSSQQSEETSNVVRILYTIEEEGEILDDSHSEIAILMDEDKNITTDSKLQNANIKETNV